MVVRTEKMSVGRGVEQPRQEVGMLSTSSPSWLREQASLAAPTQGGKGVLTGGRKVARGRPARACDPAAGKCTVGRRAVESKGG